MLEGPKTNFVRGVIGGHTWLAVDGRGHRQERGLRAISRAVNHGADGRFEAGDTTACRTSV